MSKIEVTRTELVWPGKYNDDGTLNEVPHVNLPFQVIETINESRATRETKKTGLQTTLFDVYEGKEGDTFEDGWTNKLIWGDNLLALGSMLDRFGGKVDLIYIDPPFATGADFSFTAPIGDSGQELAKEQSAIEEKAYRDTWGRGLESYVSMINARLALAYELLAPTGAMYVHCDPRVNSHIRLVMDGLFGPSGFINEIIWKRASAHNMKTRGYVRGNDTILFFAKGSSYKFNQLYTAYSEAQLSRYKDDGDGRLYKAENLTFSTPNPSRQFEWRGTRPPPNRSWGASLDQLEQWWGEGRILTKRDGTPRMDGLKIYLDDTAGGNAVTTLWDDIERIGNTSSERLDYPTQKPEALLKRIVEISSDQGDLVADFFSGSGTTLAVAEKMKRRWIGCDLGRWGIHTTRKRLLAIQGCSPFEVLNLGTYERQYWQTVTFGEARTKSATEQSLYEYLAFVLKLYGGQPIAGMEHVHGKKGKAMIHIGAVDAPVTIGEIDAAVNECAKVKQLELHVLGWDWEMGLYDLMVEAAKKKGVRLLLLQIPREVMEQQAADKGDVRFFELAYLAAEIEQPKKLTAQVALKDFVIPNTELIPEDVREKVKKWSDYIDYWAVDWDFQDDTFMQGWVAYRTRKDRKLLLTSDAHRYDKTGKYRILVKVIDIFGNDTSQAFDVEVK
jgi:DNA modification methylase